MVADGIIGRDPALRVAASGGDSRGNELLAAAREPETAAAVAGVGSSGFSGLEPLVVATLDGETAFFSDPSTEAVRELLTALDDGTLVTEGALAVVEHESNSPTLPRPDDGTLGVGTPTVLAGCGWAVPTSLDDYADDPISSAVPESATESLRESGLRGRGRGDVATDAPIAPHWETVAETDGDPVVVVNGNEADPNAEMDRLLLESAPFRVLDPAFAAAVTVGATDLVLYVNETEPTARERAETAADELAEVVEGVSVRVVVGPDEYKAGEPTMALEAIEGNHRLEARRTPPGPSEYGIDGRPTLLHTPRTFAQIGCVLGGESKSGTADSGTRLFSVTGENTDTATVELSTDSTLDAALPAVGVEDAKRACVGGVFGGLTRSLDVPASASGLKSAGLGTNGVVEVFDGSTCPVAFAGERAAFAKAENCGRCVPCREGSKQLVNLLRDVYDGNYEDGMLRELARTMDGTSLCGFGRDASRPVRTAMATFETDFAAHAAGRCPAGVCDL